MEPSWIITLHAAASPALLPEPRGLMAQYDLFTSRTLEDGRERFRLHVGFFEDLPTAKSVLRVARETCPAAWLVPADHYPALRRVPKETPKEAGEVAAAELAPAASEMPPAPSVAAAPPAEAPLAEAPPAMAPPVDAVAPSAQATVLEAAEVFALLGGAADLLAGVLPEVKVAEGAHAPGWRTAASDVPAGAGAGDPRSAEALVRAVSRFIVEEWQPESRRPLRPPAERAWYARFRRPKGQGRTKTAAS